VEAAEPQKETVRTGLAALFGCDREEIAITERVREPGERPAGSRAAAGDEVLTTSQDYPRMIDLEAARAPERIVLKQVKIPVPCEDPAAIVKAFEPGSRRRRRSSTCHVEPDRADPPVKQSSDGAPEGIP
jgi:hypothetical protein